jgi:hypothetical protein
MLTRRVKAIHPIGSTPGEFLLGIHAKTLYYSADVEFSGALCSRLPGRQFSRLVLFHVATKDGQFDLIVSHEPVRITIK